MTAWRAPGGAAMFSAQRANDIQPPRALALGGCLTGCAWLCFLVATLLASGCERALHNMYVQPKLKQFSASTLWRDGMSARPEELGVVVHSAGTLAATSSGRQGQVAPAATTTPSRNPLPITATLLEQGRSRFNIFCSPCHSELGDGDGMDVRRGFPRPPSFHTDRLRQASDAHFYTVMSEGLGDMYAYGDRLDPDERWAIVAYIRALQLAQNARIEHVPTGQRIEE